MANYNIVNHSLIVDFGGNKSDDAIIPGKNMIRGTIGQKEGHFSFSPRLAMHPVTHIITIRTQDSHLWQTSSTVLRSAKHSSSSDDPKPRCVPPTKK